MTNNKNNNQTEFFNNSELYVARHTQAKQRRERAKRRNTIIATSCCILAAAASFVVLAVTFSNVNSKQQSTAAKTNIAAQLAENSKGAAAVTTNKIEPQTNAPATAAPSTAAQETKASAPGKHHSGATWDGKGSPLHVSATGKTSYGYDWTFEGGGGIASLACDYTFADNHYDFSIIGKAPGTASMTIYYFTDNNQKAPITVNFKVDNDLVVTQI